MNVHPSENLRDYRDSSPHTQKEIAEIMGVTPKTVSLLMNGKARITLNIAKRLEVVFGRPAHFWLNLQQNWDLGNKSEVSSDKGDGFEMPELLSDTYL